MMYKTGIDVGGTFSDFIVTDDEGNVKVFKVHSTPEDPSDAVLQGLTEMAKSEGLSLEDFLGQVELIVHGTTITTNAVLTHSGAKTGFITTKGFKDNLNQRRGVRQNQYDTKSVSPPPLVPRRLIQVVEERVDYSGKQIVPLNHDDVLNAIKKLKDEKVEAMAISYLFSFLNPSSERMTKEMIVKEMPGVYLSVSNEIMPQVRFYERNSTTVLNAYVGLPLSRYLADLIKRLDQSNFKGMLLIMQSNGGVMIPEVAAKGAYNMLLSGPASAPTAGLFFTRKYDFQNIITVDMGGTSFDACMIRDGKPDMTAELDIGGYKFTSMAIDINTIGAGGGSIARVSVGGLLEVGPESAGANPGPACYGLGGKRPTCTDADLVLGYVDPDNFHGGGTKLYPELAKKAIKEEIADKLKIGTAEAAYGIYEVININMVSGVRAISTQRGVDPRDFILIVAGGAGPVHGAMIAKELEIPLISIPKMSSVFCAIGMLISNLRRSLVSTYIKPFTRDSVDIERLNGLLEKMKIEATGIYRHAGISDDKIHYHYSADLRYEGQFNEVIIPLPISSQGKLIEENIGPVTASFEKAHKALYGYNSYGSPVEVINLRLSVEGVTKKPVFKEETQSYGADSSYAQKSKRKAYFEGRFIEVPIYDGDKIANGNKVNGPAIIEETTTTIVIPPDYDLLCDSAGNYLMYNKETELQEAIQRIRRKI